MKFIDGSTVTLKAAHSLSGRQYRYQPRYRWMRWLLVPAAVLLFAGCKCTVFSQSPACQVAMAGEIALLAPVAGVKNLHENLQARREQRRLRRRVLAGGVGGRNHVCLPVQRTVEAG